MSYHIAKKHSAPKPVVTFRGKLCYQEFPGLYALRQQIKNQHGSPIKTANVNMDHIINRVDAVILKEELRSYHHSLVESEFKRLRHKVFIHAIGNLNAKIVKEKLHPFFKYAAKVNLSFRFILRNIEPGGLRYFYIHQNNTLLDQSKLVCTQDDMTQLIDILNKTDVKESCSQERLNTMRRFYKLTNLTVFAVLIKDESLDCKDAVLP